MQGQQTQGPPRHGDLTDALARLLADDPNEAARAGQDLGLGASGQAETAAAFLLAAAPRPDEGLVRRTLERLPEGSPEAYGRLGAAVLAAWTDARLREHWRADPVGMAASVGLPPASSRLARVVGPDEAHLPRRDAIAIPLPPPTSAVGSRGDALRQLAATEFGWLLAGVPGGAAALGLAFPADASVAGAGRRKLPERLAGWLHPRGLLLAGGLACLAAAIGLSLAAGGDGGLAGAALDTGAAWRLPAAAMSLAAALVLFVLAGRRRR